MFKVYYFSKKFVERRRRRRRRIMQLQKKINVLNKFQQSNIIETLSFIAISNEHFIFSM
jgi:hypothetical protein